MNINDKAFVNLKSEILEYLSLSHSPLAKLLLGRLESHTVELEAEASEAVDAEESKAEKLS